LLPKYLKILELDVDDYSYLPETLLNHNFTNIDTIKCKGIIFNDIFEEISLNNIYLD
jgi:hypothetical protein